VHGGLRKRVKRADLGLALPCTLLSTVLCFYGLQFSKVLGKFNKLSNYPRYPETLLNFSKTLLNFSKTLLNCVPLFLSSKLIKQATNYEQQAPDGEKHSD
jgi:hypothetical protein